MFEKNKQIEIIKKQYPDLGVLYYCFESGIKSGMLVKENSAIKTRILPSAYLGQVFDESTVKNKIKEQIDNDLTIDDEVKAEVYKQYMDFLDDKFVDVIMVFLTRAK